MVRGLAAVAVLAVSGLFAVLLAGQAGAAVTTPMVVLSCDDSGIKAPQQDYSQFMLSPPGNTLRAQVINRIPVRPRIVTTGIVRYSIPGNTQSATETNFWTYCQQLLGVTLAPNIGTTGNGLAGKMKLTGANDWAATAIPATPKMDSGAVNCYQPALIKVFKAGVVQATTRTVVPVSWQTGCVSCHGTASDIVSSHPTSLSKPANCNDCHSAARYVHRSHARRISGTGTAQCYKCHPGTATKFYRDVHSRPTATMPTAKVCQDCHGTMASLGSSPTLPRCATCHTRAGFAFEPVGVLYKDAKGHRGVHCYACHGSPHAITPSTVAADNVQAIAAQGTAGPIGTCTVCHNTAPTGAFNHN